MITSPRSSINFDSSIEIGNAEIKPTPYCRNLGLMFDNHLNMAEHEYNVCRTTLYHLRNIGSIRSGLDDSSAAQLVHSLVTSRLDYCNSMLYGIPDCQLSCLQRVQNVAARIVARTNKFSNITFMYNLHWLTVRYRIIFKILLLTYRCLHGLAPPYLIELITPYHQARPLCSSSPKLLEIPKTKLKTYGDRSFLYAAAFEWNKLPLEIKNSVCIGTFKTRLKTHLFKLCYD